METIDVIKEILNDCLDIDPTDITMDSTFESLHVDSIDMMQLICELEEKCDIDFGEPEGLTTMSELVAYVDSLK